MKSNHSERLSSKTAALFLLISLSTSNALSVCAAEQTPKEAYVKYHAIMLGAGKIEDVQPYLCKRVNKEIDETPGMMRPMMFGIMKTVMPGPVKIESEKVDGNTATLNLQPDYSKAPKADPNEKGSGTVTLIKEDGAWKIDREKWDFKTQIGGESTSEAAPSANK